MFLILALFLSLAACGAGDDAPVFADGGAAGGDAVSQADADGATDSGDLSPDDSDDAALLSASELGEQLLELPLAVTDVKYVIQDDEYKTLYPDLLQAELKNNSDTDIQHAVVAFAAWDENNLPVKIAEQMDFSGGSYVCFVEYEGVNMIPGAIYDEGNGYRLAADNRIETVKAVVCSYETFDGECWENPYFSDWRRIYEEQRLAAAD